MACVTFIIATIRGEQQPALKIESPDEDPFHLPDTPDSRASRDAIYRHRSGSESPSWPLQPNKNTIFIYKFILALVISYRYKRSVNVPMLCIIKQWQRTHLKLVLQCCSSQICTFDLCSFFSPFFSNPFPVIGNTSGLISTQLHLHSTEWNSGVY